MTDVLKTDTVGQRFTWRIYFNIFKRWKQYLNEQIKIIKKGSLRK